jgi:predicted nucleic acid-binding Zn ribbon protein
MRKRDAEPIGNLIRRYLRQQSLESPLNEQRLINEWHELLGPAICRYTENLYIRNQVLYVHFTSSVIRQELMMERKMLVQKLNERVGANVIIDIVFR